ncbi:flagellar protein FlbD [Cytobacillus horneckiae]|uniref:Flagellar protein FlbD n=1 Tax=Cytobacillus horneckiae TaxID=549687 RepID=A0A2N0ZM23_9BACI|nr:flagellar FlbD family protein [Cytobacillus horneckiae]NRG43422.1 flagellar FlbD family protein [Bacillus sp. CRN 9]MBN6887171.1 flagellar FlbD family protein [Cytobacillus horneckiae]MCM3178238.1 flagellar FlbD family protein [Cytobacillus horneckiae]MEC1157022.1 flagellar FlbD family protein [Cytobacillus horneckiae]MED2939952.1 flagellar FlbD family protein [Cytobacillus horneckiae]
MIKVSRLNGKPFILNAIYIETIESFPDTTITLTNGRKYVVKEDEACVTELVHQFYHSIGLTGVQMGRDENEEI